MTMGISLLSSMADIPFIRSTAILKEYTANEQQVDREVNLFTDWFEVELFDHVDTMRVVSCFSRYGKL